MSIKQKRFNLPRAVPHMGVSDFVSQFYEEYLPDPIENNKFIEIGVGHTVNKRWTLDQTLGCISGGYTPEMPQDCGSNTLDLLDCGFEGIYIDPVIEFLWELQLSTKNKVAISLNYGCSNKTEFREMYSGESLLPNDNHLGSSGVDYIGRAIFCMPLSDILDTYNLTGPFALMSIDAEGMEPLVLEGIREEHLPKIMILETTHCGENVVDDKMISLGYELKVKSEFDSGYVKSE